MVHFWANKGIAAENITNKKRLFCWCAKILIYLHKAPCYFIIIHTKACWIPYENTIINLVNYNADQIFVKNWKNPIQRPNYFTRTQNLSGDMLLPNGPLILFMDKQSENITQTRITHGYKWGLTCWLVNVGYNAILCLSRWKCAFSHWLRCIPSVTFACYSLFMAPPGWDFFQLTPLSFRPLSEIKNVSESRHAWSKSLAISAVCFACIWYLTSLSFPTLTHTAFCQRFKISR